MRNPERIADFLRILLPYENHTLTHDIIMRIVASLIQNKLYIPNYASRHHKHIIESDELFSEMQVQEIIEHSPQEHKEAGFAKGWDSRFDTWYKLCKEFGFCTYAMNEPLLISNTGHLLIDALNEVPSNESKIANVFLNCMMKYQSNNPFRNTRNANVPLLLLLNTMWELRNLSGDSKIFKLELAFLLCWRDSNARRLARYILALRYRYKHFCYSFEMIYTHCLKLLDSTNTTRFKISQICSESIDDYIRKMRITGIISLRGNGRFLDFNTFEMPKVCYVLEHYSHFTRFASKEAYFSYMGEIDTHILSIQPHIDSTTEENLKLKRLEKFALSYTKEQIYKELAILSHKKSSSSDEVFKFIPEPTRFEFLTAIALKQHFPNVKIMPQYSIDDEGLPKCHASGNCADIICIESACKSIVEVSLICGRGQVHNELLPIRRHLKEMIESSKEAHGHYFALFIAPRIFEDSAAYVEFLKFKENLEIKNLSIIDFISFIKAHHKFLDFLYV